MLLRTFICFFTSLEFCGSSNTDNNLVINRKYPKCSQSFVIFRTQAQSVPN